VVDSTITKQKFGVDDRIFNGYVKDSQSKGCYALPSSTINWSFRLDSAPTILVIILLSQDG
jgi:hypothetical protein